MTGSTSRYALPYPVGTDPVANGDDTAAAMAARLDLLLGETGLAAITPSAADATTSVRVNYARDYTAVGVPVVFAVNNLNLSTAAQVNVWANGEDATGFTLNIRASTTTTRNIRWMCRPA